MSKLTTGHEHLQPSLRAALGRFATGVTIITCIDAGGAKFGLTANSFSALSLEPPLVLWSLRSESSSLDTFRNAQHFAVNVLDENQLALAHHFTGPASERFSKGIWHDGEGGVPVLNAAAAVFECEMTSQQDAGDHVLFIGRVVRFADGGLPPLVFHAGGYFGLGAAM